VQRGRTRALVNTAEAPTAALMHDRDWRFPAAGTLRQLREAVGAEEDCLALDAQELATRLLGDAIYSNPLILGAAWQRGWIPLELDSLRRAIELNAVSVERNLRAFDWGRAAAHDLAAVLRGLDATVAAPAAAAAPVPGDSLAALVASRAAYLVGYQGEALAQRYRALVERVRAAEEACRSGSTALAEAVARNYFRLLAVKDEYEVARLHRDPQMRARIAAQFSGRYRIRYHLAPPLLAPRDRSTGRPRKLRLGAWMGGVFAVLARLKFLRGGWLDPFGHTEERRIERALCAEYEAIVGELVAGLRPERLALALRLADLPDMVRGYGHVKLESVARARPLLDQLKKEWAAG
jgi:indolepyruvate ferredoxin oxidoreductase